MVDCDGGKVISTCKSQRVQYDGGQQKKSAISTSVDDVRQQCAMNTAFDASHHYVSDNRAEGKNVGTTGIRTVDNESPGKNLPPRLPQRQQFTTQHQQQFTTHQQQFTSHQQQQLTTHQQQFTTHQPQQFTTHQQQFTAAKRPIVPVHPYNEQEELVVGTDCFNGDQHISFNDEKSFSPNKCSSPLSPKPPVPPKPDKCQSSIAKKQPAPPPRLPPKATTSSPVTLASDNVTYRRSDYRGDPPLSGGRGPPVNGTTPFKLPEDDEMSRRSRIVAENSNDAGLIDILVGQQRQSVDYISIVFDRARPQLMSHSANKNAENSPQFCRNGDTIPNVYFDACSSSSQSSADEGATTIQTPLDLEKEKKKLITSLSSKLAVLKKTLREVELEIRHNDALGQNIRTIVETSDTSIHDKDSFRLHIEDTEKITHLLLKLSAQLARVENDLNRMPVTCSPKEKQHLTDRRQRLMTQLQDAKCLKEDLDRRGDNVLSVLENILDKDSLIDYQLFIQMKSQLLIDVREIEDKMKLGEDQKKALEDSLINA